MTKKNQEVLAQFRLQILRKYAKTHSRKRMLHTIETSAFQMQLPIRIKQ